VRRSLNPFLIFLIRGAASVLAVAGLVTSVEALTITTTASGTNTSGDSVSGSVRFITSLNKIDVFLTNLTANPDNIAQVLTNLEFHLSTGQTTASVANTFAQLRTVNSDGTFTAGSKITSSDWTIGATSYTYENATVSGMKLTALGPPNGAEQGIIGPPDGSMEYSDANSSVAGSPPHNPFLWNLTSDSSGATYPTGVLFPNGAVHFVLTVAGVTSASSVDHIVFSWGSTEGNFLEVPLPASMLILASGLGVIFVRSRLRRTSRSAIEAASSP